LHCAHHVSPMLPDSRATGPWTHGENIPQYDAASGIRRHADRDRSAFSSWI
jgi:hypothetical protein